MPNNIPTVPLDISTSDRIDVVVSAYIQPFSYEIFSAPARADGGIGAWTRIDVGNHADTRWSANGAALEGKFLFIAVTPRGDTQNSIYDINAEVVRVSQHSAEKVARWTVPKGTPAGAFPANVLLRFV
ncbi:MAG: hypothetical protein EOP84_24175 [Verrucomicrobiaceae bacterium]|nr:MAG: hypothetical protein EOP84_24175 [Verrucomicrobiaceae bacterium]